MRLVSWKFVPRQVFWPPFEQVVNDLCFHFMLQIHFGDRIGCMHPVSEFRERWNAICLSGIEILKSD